MLNNELLQYLATLTDVPAMKTTYMTHGIHQYPAKFIPELPQKIIQECTKERNTILDPFCGSGTTLLEAALCGRKSIGVDSNPIAALVSKVKTQPLSKDEIKQIDSIIGELSKVGPSSLERKWVPDDKNLSHWFQESVITELSWLKDYIERIQLDNLRNFLLCIFSSIIVTVSNQESSTRYAAKEKNIKVGGVITSFLRKLKAEKKGISLLSENRNAIRNVPKVINKDLTIIDDSDIPENSVDIIITSPPYANSYDYYLYHKWRMVWLGYDYHAVQEQEIGSRHEHSSKKAPLSTFEDRMIPAMFKLSKVLKPNKMAFFFVGDSIIAGELINMSDCFKRIAEQSGFKFVCETEYSLAEVTRSFTEKKNTSSFRKSAIDSKKMQRVLVFETSKKESKGDKSRIAATPYSTLAQVDLGICTPNDGAVVSIHRNDDDLSIHSLGKYPAKFLPDIPRWAIKNYTKVGDTVLDPFNGSGTTMVEAILSNRNGIGMDISPFACLLASAKKPLKYPTAFKKNTHRLVAQLETFDAEGPQSRLSFENDLFWFSEKNLIEIEFIRNSILSLSNKESIDFYLAVLSTIIKPCSFLDESQIKVKRSQKKLLNGVPSPVDLMKKQVKKLSEIKINAYADYKDLGDASIINRSVLDLGTVVDDGSVDLIITSPPYINAMNYPMNHRYESFLLKLLNPNDSIAHQQEYIGTERVFARDYKELHQFDPKSYLGKALNRKLQEIFELEPKRSFITYKYFEEMHQSFLLMHKALKKNGRLIVVVGTNTIKGVPIDTFRFLQEDLVNLGFADELSFKYEIINNALKISRHETSDIIKYDGVGVLKKR